MSEIHAAPSVGPEGAIRAELIGQLIQTMRETSGQSVLFNQAVAERLGLNATDLRCLDIVGRRGPLTAGQLAELTGLTTGAITGVIDHLEAVGFARRERDPRDRRRVVVRALPAHARSVAPLFDSMRDAMVSLCADYSDRDLALILDFYRRLRPILQDETGKLRSGR